MAPKSGTGQFFWKGHTLYPTRGGGGGTTSEQEAEVRGTAKRQRQTFQISARNGDTRICNGKCVDIPTTGAYTARDTNILSLYHCQPVKMHGNSTHTYRASKALAGRIRNFLPNLVKLTQDPWELDAVQGFRVPFTQQPSQKQPPKPLTHSEVEKNPLQEEMQSMTATEDTTPKGHGFLSMVFLVSKMEVRALMNTNSLNRFVHTLRWRASMS